MDEENGNELGLQQLLTDVNKKLYACCTLISPNN
jgi:hypothetical protein